MTRTDLHRFLEGEWFENYEGTVIRKLNSLETGFEVGYFEDGSIKWKQGFSLGTIKKRIESGSWEPHEHNLRKENVGKPREGPNGTVLVEVWVACTECGGYWTGEAKLTEQ
ncbi:MAG: hypothetical protein ABEH81_01485 [Halopenitus sp.]